MFEEYAKKTRVGDRLRSYILAVPAVLAFCLILVFFGLFSSLRSGKERKELQRLAEMRQALLNSIQVSVVESGFLKRNVGGADLYVPMMTVEIANISSSAIENLQITGFFESESVFSCQSFARIYRLGPGEITEASLRCIEPTALGSVITGISLAQTMQPVNFSVHIRHEDVYATVQRGTSTFRLLGPAPPIPLK
jgi:hypothetical protein